MMKQVQILLLVCTTAFCAATGAVHAQGKRDLNEPGVRPRSAWGTSEDFNRSRVTQGLTLRTRVTAADALRGIRGIVIHHTNHRGEGEKTPVAGEGSETCEIVCDQEVCKVYCHHFVNKEWRDIGYNEIICMDGCCRQGTACTPEGLVARGIHAGPNSRISYGVALLGNFHGVDPFPATMEDQLVDRIVKLCKKFDINPWAKVTWAEYYTKTDSKGDLVKVRDITRDSIVGHNEIRGATRNGRFYAGTECPGRDVDLDRIRALVRAKFAAEYPQLAATYKEAPPVTRPAQQQVGSEPSGATETVAAESASGPRVEQLRDTTGIGVVLSGTLSRVQPAFGGEMDDENRLVAVLHGSGFARIGNFKRTAQLAGETVDVVLGWQSAEKMTAVIKFRADLPDTYATPQFEVDPQDSKRLRVVYAAADDAFPEVPELREEATAVRHKFVLALPGTVTKVTHRKFPIVAKDDPEKVVGEKIVFYVAGKGFPTAFATQRKTVTVFDDLFEVRMGAKSAAEIVVVFELALPLRTALQETLWDEAPKDPKRPNEISVIFSKAKSH